MMGYGRGDISVEEIQRNHGSQGPNLLVCGDLNAWIGQLNEYIVLDDGRHIEALPTNYVGNFILP